MDRRELADFLRQRREALRPEDVGLTSGPRRRVAGLRHEEVATLASMATDSYSRLEQQRGPQPSEPMLAAVARGLRLSRAERDHLFRLAGHTAPAVGQRSDHPSPVLMRVLDRLDTAAQVMSDLGHTLAQNRFAVALLGDQTIFTGLARSVVYRWFTNPAERGIYSPADQPYHSRVYAAGLRARLTTHSADSRARELVDALVRDSNEFAELWNRHEVVARTSDRKRMVHPAVGTIELDCQTLIAESHAQILLVYTATPGSEDYNKLQLLSVIGAQRFNTSTAVE